jgi:hypothetical protein
VASHPKPVIVSTVTISQKLSQGLAGIVITVPLPSYQGPPLPLYIPLNLITLFAVPPGRVTVPKVNVKSKAPLSAYVLKGLLAGILDSKEAVPVLQVVAGAAGVHVVI